MRGVTRLEINKHEAMHEVVIEDEVDEEVAPVHADTLLTRLKRETATGQQTAKADGVSAKWLSQSSMGYHISDVAFLI